MRQIINIIIAKLKSKRTRKLELENVLIIANFQIKSANFQKLFSESLGGLKGLFLILTWLLFENKLHIKHLKR